MTDEWDFAVFGESEISEGDVILIGRTGLNAPAFPILNPSLSDRLDCHRSEAEVVELEYDPEEDVTRFRVEPTGDGSLYQMARQWSDRQLTAAWLNRSGNRGLVSQDDLDDVYLLGNEMARRLMEDGNDD